MRKLQEITLREVRAESEKEYAILDKEDMISLCEKKVTKANRVEQYWNCTEHTLTCYSKKLRTLGTNEHTFKQKGRLVTLHIYMDSHNSRETKYFKIID